MEPVALRLVISGTVAQTALPEAPISPPDWMDMLVVPVSMPLLLTRLTSPAAMMVITLPLTISSSAFSEVVIAAVAVFASSVADVAMVKRPGAPAPLVVKATPTPSILVLRVTVLRATSESACAACSVPMVRADFDTRDIVPLVDTRLLISPTSI